MFVTPQISIFGIYRKNNKKNQAKYNAMKTINLKSTLVVLFCAFLGVNQACNQKEEVINDLSTKSNKPESIMGYYNAFTQAADGKFALKSYTTLASQDFDGSSILDGFFFDKEGKTVGGSNGRFKIGNLELRTDPKNNNCYCSEPYNRNAGTDLHGKTIRISIAPPSNSNLRTSSDSIGTEIYIPSLVKIIIPVKYESSLEQPYLPISVGGQIAWNVDENNKKGIVILLEYDPSALENEYLQSKGELVNGKIKKAHAITLKDTDGFYTFSNDDLKDFPTNAYIKLTIGRANFTTINGESKSYTFFAYTVVASSFQVKK